MLFFVNYFYAEIDTKDYCKCKHFNKSTKQKIAQKKKICVICKFFGCFEDCLLLLLGFLDGCLWLIKYNL